MNKQTRLNNLACWLVKNDEKNEVYQENYNEFGRLTVWFSKYMARNYLLKANFTNQMLEEELVSFCREKITILIKEKKYNPDRGTLTKLIHSIYAKEIIKNAYVDTSLIRVPPEITKKRKQLKEKLKNLHDEIEDKRYSLNSPDNKTMNSSDSHIRDLKYQAALIEEELHKLGFSRERSMPAGYSRVDPLDKLIDIELLQIIRPMIQNVYYTLGFNYDCEDPSKWKEELPPVILREIALFDQEHFIDLDSLPIDIKSYRSRALERMQKLGVPSLTEIINNVSL